MVEEGDRKMGNTGFSKNQDIFWDVLLVFGVAVYQLTSNLLLGEDTSPKYALAGNLMCTDLIALGSTVN